MEKDKSMETCLALIEQELAHIKKTVDGMHDKMEASYVTKIEFDSFLKNQHNPIKSIVHGMVALVLVAVVGAVLTLILK